MRNHAVPARGVSAALTGPRVVGGLPLTIALFSRLAAAAGLLIVSAVPLAAQETFTNVQHLLRPGDTVFVIDETGIETRGRVAGINSSALRLAVNGSEREWSAATIWRVTRRGDSLKNGMLIGAVTGGVIGGVGGLALASLLRNEGHEAVGPFFFLLGVGAGGGAGIGAGLDALIAGRTVIYQQRSARVMVVPVVTPHTQAMQFGFRF